MRAALTTAYGPPSVLEIADIPRPEIGDRDVLVDVTASAVTGGDRRLRSGDFPAPFGLAARIALGIRRPRAPVQGTMFAGRVREVGRAVTRFRPGDDVFGEAMGTYAEQIRIAEDAAIAPIPAPLSHAEAAPLGYGAATAIHFLRDVAEVSPGERVLILGAAGGVGRYAVQVAKHLDAHVTAVCAARSAAYVRELGADEVVDYRTTDVLDQDSTFDVVFDTADAATFPRARPRLSARGRFVTLLASPGALWHMLATKLGRGPRALTGVAISTAASIEEVAAWVGDGILTPQVAARFPLDRIVEAHARAEAGGVDGDVIVEMGPVP